MSNMLNIGKLEEGFVLDHIEAGKSMEIYKYLHLDKLDCCVEVIKNARSTKYGRKDIIKVDGDIKLDLDMLGYIDSNITVNVIENSKLVNKLRVTCPDTLTNVIRCNNPRCITSIEQGIDQQFKLVDRKNKIYRCVYCDAEYSEK